MCGVCIATRLTREKTLIKEMNKYIKSARKKGGRNKSCIARRQKKINNLQH
jgi:hypothetical protein